jgi:hypothetical protein
VNNRVAEKEGVDAMAMRGGVCMTGRRGKQQEGEGSGSGCCGKTQQCVWQGRGQRSRVMRKQWKWTLL